jgi:exosome complex component RRP4
VPCTSRTKTEEGSPDVQDISPEGRQAISTVAGIIQVFASHNIPLSDTLISDGYNWLVSTGGNLTSLNEEGGRQMIASITGVDVDGQVE